MSARSRIWVRIAVSTKPTFDARLANARTAALFVEVLALLPMRKRVG